MNFTVTFANQNQGQFVNDEDRYTVTDSGVLRLDVTENGKRVRRHYSPGAWLEVLDLKP